MKKKLLSIAIAITLSLTLSSCGQKKKENTADNAAPQSAYSLNAADVSMDNQFTEFLCLDSIDDSVLVFGKLADNSYGGYISNKELSVFDGFSFVPSDGEKVITAAMTSETDKAILTYKDNKTVIHTFNSEGNESDVMEYDNITYNDGDFAELLAVGNGYYININNENVYYADNSGNAVPVSPLDGKDILAISKNTEDKAVIILTGIDGNTTIADLNESSIVNKRACDDNSNSVLAACKGYGDYEIAVVFFDGMYGLKENKWVKLSDFMDNTFSAYNITNLVMTSDNNFIVSVYDGEKSTLKRLTQRTSEEATNQEIIKIAAIQGGLLSDYYLKEYNSSQSKYKVEIANYNDENIEDCIRNLKMDIISGNGPDIIPFDVRMPIDSFGSDSGVFIDLYSLLDDDPDLKRTDFVDGFLKGLETDGKLLMISPSFSISTIECKNKYLENLTDWDYNKMMEICNDNIDNISISAKAKYESHTEAFLDLIKYYPYINYSQTNCNFNNSTFINLMKYFKDNEIGIKNPTGWDSSMIIDSFKSDAIMLNVTQEQNFLSLYNMNRERFNEEATVIGYPTAEGSVSYVEIETGFAILSNSDVKEGAWDFIKSEFLSDKYYSGTEGSYIFPAIDKQIDNQLSTLNTNLAKWKSEGDNCEPMTEEQMAEYASWVRENAANVVKRDSSVEVILREELNSYFNNECSAEDAAERIQSRVTLYLSEQYQ